MTGLGTAYRCAAGAILGLALFGAASHGVLLAGGDLQPALLPLGLAAGLALASPPALLAPRDPTPVPRWLVAAVLAIVAAVTVAVAYGSLVTPARMWDGFISYEVKADFLTREPTFEQDYFRQPSVFCHSRDYPILQPVTIAAGHRLLGAGHGRVLLPLLYLVLVTIVGVAVRARAASSWLGPAAAAAVAVTPMLVSPTLGSVDSGFAELFLSTAIAGIAAGLALRAPTLLAASTFLAVLVKPDGTIYGALPVLVLWCLRETKLLRAALLGWLAACVLWLPLQHNLFGPDRASISDWTIWGALGVLAVGVLGTDRWLRAFDTRRRTLIAAVIAPALILAVPMLALTFGGGGGTMAAYFGDAARPFERLSRLPTIAAGFVEHAFGRLKFALTYVLLGLLFATFVVRRQRPPAAALSATVGLGLLSCLGPFLLSPEDNTAHHLRSTMSRLLLQWLGATWIVIGIWLGDALVSAASPAVNGTRDG